MTNDRETENRGEPFENDAKSDFASAAEDAKSQSGSPDKKKSEIKLTSDTEKDCALRRRR